MGGFGKKMPGIAAFFTIGGLTSLGLPGLSGFVAEFQVFLGAWRSHNRWWLIPAVLGAFITAVYVLRVLKIIFWGPFKEEDYPHLEDGKGPEWVALAILSGVIIVLGILPFIILNPIDVSVVSLLEKIGGALP
jgi:NADH-quinone oxidoreductase subunit M